MREGNWTFYRLERGEDRTSDTILTLLNPDDPVIAADLQRLASVRERREVAAEAYFERHARQWDAIRALYVEEELVEKQLLSHVPPHDFRSHLDIGTGTGRILMLLAPRVQSAVGVDNSRAMLAIARDRVSRAGLSNVSLRLADLYNLPLADNSVDLVTIHLVLHYTDAPEQAVAEASRVLRPGGRLIIADFAPHSHEELRTQHEHRRLGFADEEVRQWFENTGLQWRQADALPGRALTVVLWAADVPGADVKVSRLPAAASPWL